MAGASSWETFPGFPGSNINGATLRKRMDITAAQQSHLVNVYAATVATIVACAVGALTNTVLHIGGLLTSFAGLGALIWLSADQDKTNYPQRMGILLLFGTLQGLSLGNLLDSVVQVDPSIPITAFLGTTVIFLCFGGAALFARRRSYLYLGGILSSAMMMLMATRVLNLFIRADFLFSVQTYAGLFMFCGYVVFDTQMIVEKAALGQRDFVWHAAELFIDFVGIFVRICIILVRNKEECGRTGSGRNKGNRTGHTVRR